MSKRRRIYEGKAKVLYEGTLIQHFKDDATGFNAKYADRGQGGAEAHLRVHFPTPRRDRRADPFHEAAQHARAVAIMRNVAAGSLATRLGLEEDSGCHVDGRSTTRPTT